MKPPKTVLNFSKTVILTSAVVTALIVGARQAGMLEGMELSVYDAMTRSRPDEGADDRLLVVGVTEADIQMRKEYPLHDGTLAQLLEKLQQYQPRTIGIDIIRDVPQGNPKGRIALEKILKESDRAIAVCKLSSATDPGTAGAPGVPEERIGFADLPLDPGGTLRRSLLVSTPAPSQIPLPEQHLCNFASPDNQVASLDLQLVQLYLEPMGIEPELTPSGEIKIGQAVLKRLSENAGSYRNTDAGNYQIMLNYRSAQNAVKQVTLTDVLDGKIEPNWVKDRIILIGYTAPFVKDDFFTPYSGGARDNQTMPGVVIHAQNVSQILSAVLDNRPLIWYWSEWAEIVWIGGWALLGGILGWSARRLWLFALLVAAALGILGGICWVLFLGAGWIPLVPPALGVAIAAVSVVFVKYGKAIYQVVKKVIIDIQIDEEKKQRELAAITESESFRELEQKAEALRTNRKRERSRDRRSRKAFLDTPPISQPAEEEDYFQQLQAKGQSLKNSDEETFDNSLNGERSPNLEPPETEDYFQQFRKNAKTILNSEDASNNRAIASNESANIEEATPSPSAEEPATEGDYFAQLQKRGKRLRKTADASETSVTITPIEVATSSPNAAEPPETEDYLEQLQRRGKRLRKTADKSER